MDELIQCPEDILKRAADYKEACEITGRKVEWSDYEYFKQKLLDRGYYGYESQLADALNL